MVEPRVRVASGVVIHGGVGTLSPSRLTGELLRSYEEALEASLAAGRAALTNGGDAVDAVVAAICVMEDSPLFNAGRGSNLDARGVVTMDASLMRGRDGAGGAVAGVTRTRNPILAARAVLEVSEHVLLIGDGADAFAQGQGLAMEDNDYFITDRRRRDLERARRHASGRPNVLGDDEQTGTAATAARTRTGTVGAVALDRQGNLASGTSTGGMANKAWGRVGDSPVIGAGTWASSTCAVSCTGWGEQFLTRATAHDVHARMVHGGASLQEAVDGVIWDVLHTEVPRSGGLVALDGEGNVELCFNTPGMYRGWVDEAGRSSVEIFGRRG